MKKTEETDLKRMRQTVCFAATVLSFLLVFGPAEASADTYEYDALNRVTKVTYEDGSSVVYEYDANGNIKSQTRHGKEGAGSSTGGGTSPGAGGTGESPSAGGQGSGQGTQGKKVHKNGMKAKNGNATYVITSVKKKTVTFYKLTNKKKKSYTVPNYVKIDGVKYNVTKIDAKAFKNNKKLKKVTI